MLKALSKSFFLISFLFSFFSSGYLNAQNWLSEGFVSEELTGYGTMLKKENAFKGNISGKPLFNNGLMDSYKLGISWSMLMGEVVEDYTYVWEQNINALKCSIDLGKYPDISTKVKNIAPTELFIAVEMEFYKGGNLLATGTKKIRIDLCEKAGKLNYHVPGSPNWSEFMKIKFPREEYSSVTLQLTGEGKYIYKNHKNLTKLENSVNKTDQAYLNKEIFKLADKVNISIEKRYIKWDNSWICEEVEKRKKNKEEGRKSTASKSNSNSDDFWAGNEIKTNPNDDFWSGKAMTSSNINGIPFKENGKWGIKDKNGNILCPPNLDYNNIDEFSEGLAKVWIPLEDIYKIKDGKYMFTEIYQLFGYINAYGKEVIPCRYISATPFKNGFSEVIEIIEWSNKKYSNYYINCKNGKKNNFNKQIMENDFVKTTVFITAENHFRQFLQHSTCLHGKINNKGEWITKTKTTNKFVKTSGKRCSD